MNIEHVWKEFYEPLKGFISKRMNHSSDVDDIVQNVFIKIATHMPDLKEEQKIQTWIYQITRNSIIDYYRKEKPTLELPDDLQITEESDEVDLSNELSACIRPLIKQLPDKYREAIEFTELNGFSQKMLSEQLGISFSGAKSRVQRGREKLKILLTTCCHIEADRYGNINDYSKVILNTGDCHQDGTCGCE